MIENILAFKRTDIEKEWLLNRLILKLKETEFKVKFNNLEACFEDRKSIEKNPDYKQAIPYIILINEDKRIACYQRHGTEERIHGLWSIGIGGHVDYKDLSTNNYSTIKNGLIRELNEELSGIILSKKAINFIGIINEEETKVGLTHIGIVFIIKINNSSNIKPNSELKNFKWDNLEQLQKSNCELWSQLALELCIPFVK